MHPVKPDAFPTYGMNERTAMAALCGATEEKHQDDDDDDNPQDTAAKDPAGSALFISHPALRLLPDLRQSMAWPLGPFIASDGETVAENQQDQDQEQNEGEVAPQ